MLTDEDAETIRKIVTAAVKTQTCACGLTGEEQREMSHIYGFMKDVGRDSISRGVEELRENAKFVLKWRAACEKTGSVILMTIVIGIFGIGATIAGMGFWEWIKRGVK
jgi:hypothetical protein